MGRVKRVNRSVRDVRARGTEVGRTAASRGAELGRTAASRGAEIGRNMRRLDVPWARCAPARMLREAILQFGLAPLMDLYTRPRVRGREIFGSLPHPVIFVANHSSHLDTPTILRALPLRWRQRTAVAAAADYFYKSRAVANAVALIFNTVPLSRSGGGIGNGSTEHVDRLLDQRWNLLMFPEGTRSRDGRLGKMRSGAAVIAQLHDIPIVPIYVRGTHDVMPPGINWPRKRNLILRRHRLEVEFGHPIWPARDEDRHEVMARVRSFFEGEGGTRFVPAGRTAPTAPPV
jgi:1-acyl-sn-glycerol-3-phosphate acyltransferase